MHLLINITILDQETECTRQKKTKLHALKKKKAFTYREEFPICEGRGRASMFTSKLNTNLKGWKETIISVVKYMLYSNHSEQSDGDLQMRWELFAL